MNKKEGISKEEVQKEKEVYGTKGDKWLRGFGRLLFLGITLYSILYYRRNSILLESMSEKWSSNCYILHI